MNSDSNWKLDECLKSFQSEKAPKNEKEFYTKSFNLFLKLYTITKDLNLTGITEQTKQAIEDVIWEYNTLCHSYSPKAHLTKVWDLVLILYFSTQNDSYIDPLSDWLNQYYPVDPASPTKLYQFIVRGDWTMTLDELNKLKEQEAERDQWAVEKVMEEIERWSQVEGIDKWTEWREQVSSGLDRNQLSPVLLRVYAILLGDEEGGCEGLGLLDRLLAIGRFSRPGIPLIELQSVGQRIYETTDPLDKTCAYLLMGLLDDGLSYSNDLWLETHLGHAFISVDVKLAQTFQLSNVQAIVDPVYLSMNEYVKTIVAKEDMWQEAIIYLSTCKENGQDWMMKLLGDPPLNEKKVEFIKEILAIAYEYQLNDIQRLLHNALGKRQEGMGDRYQAVIEYTRAQNVDALNRLSLVELNDYLEKGKLNDVVTIREVEISQRYSLLVKYHQFHTLVNQKEYKQASNVLLELIENKELLPNQYEIVFMIDTIEILKDKENHYSFEQCLKWIELFKSIERDESKHAFISKYYKFTHQVDLSSHLILTKLRELLSYKASLSQQ
ncbi:hypothetical protein G6F64_003451 [Rhizopus arrhizus]|uniref:Nuclear pore complex protein Nup85 n=1 Tax=Rhizopus oryzae TaxID=64495 RepID=A0A9P6XEE6_RHIOR|nr:hypothetical protein G6F64_003451 [Rhizopus arrhizus]